MRPITRLYAPAFLGELGKHVRLSPKHTLKVNSVLRARVGENLIVFNESVGEYLVRLTSTRGEVEVLERVLAKSESRGVPRLTVAFSPLKPACTRFLIEKCTELGAHELVPVLTAFGQRGRWQPEKVEEWVEGALEQCGRRDCPRVSPPLTLSTFLSQCVASSRPTLLGDPESPLSLSSALVEVTNPGEVDLGLGAAFVVGPEGGWSEEEKGVFSTMEKTSQCFKRVELGSLTLRAETAAIVGLAQVGTFFLEKQKNPPPNN